jgi:UDP-glucose 4-epimerase
MNILVTGGAGFIGSHLVDKLLGQGHFVVCIDNLCLGKTENIEHNFSNSNFVFKEFNVNETEKTEEVFSTYNFSRVYHLTANSDIQKGGKDPNIDFNDTFLTTYNILNLMQKYSVDELFFASTSAVYGDKKELLTENIGELSPVSYYGAGKLASEAFISAFSSMNDMKVIILRFPNVVGERLTHGVIYDFIKKLQNNPNELEILGDGKQEKPYVYVEDLINAILFFDYNIGINIYNAGVETATTVRKIADIVCREMQLENVKYKFTGGSVGWKGDVPKFQYDLTKIHNDGWTAKYTSDEAVRLAARATVSR